MDCHNRPSHAYKLPERAIDEAMFAGDLSANLPFAKKESLEILKKPYASREAAAAAIPVALEAYYRDKYPAIYRDRQG